MLRTWNKLALTPKILIAMALALPMGAFLNGLTETAPWLQTYITDGILHVGGQLFIQALKMIVVPLVFCSLFMGVYTIGNLAELGRIGLKSFLLYMFTTAFAITTGLTLALSFNIGQGLDLTTMATQNIMIATPDSFSNILIQLIPSNILKSLAEGKMLSIIVAGILLGIAALKSGKEGKIIANTLNALNRLISKLVEMVMAFAPFAVFCLVTKVFAEKGLHLIIPLLGYFSTVAGALAIHFFVTLHFLLRAYKIPPLVILLKVRTAILFAFSTASSSATIPISKRCLTQHVGISNAVTSFTVPFGATLNMDGTSIMQGVAAVFIANIYGIDLTVLNYLTIMGMAIMASIGTAGIPGVGLIMLSMVLAQVNIPVEGIGLIIGVDRLLDMMRTAVNVAGDAVVSTIVAKSEGEIDKETFENPHLA